MKFQVEIMQKWDGSFGFEEWNISTPELPFSLINEIFWFKKKTTTITLWVIFIKLLEVIHFTEIDFISKYYLMFSSFEKEWWFWERNNVESSIWQGCFRNEVMMKEVKKQMIKVLNFRGVAEKTRANWFTVTW